MPGAGQTHRRRVGLGVADAVGCNYPTGRRDVLDFSWSVYRTGELVKGYEYCLDVSNIAIGPVYRMTYRSHVRRRARSRANAYSLLLPCRPIRCLLFGAARGDARRRVSVPHAVPVAMRWP